MTGTHTLPVTDSDADVAKRCAEIRARVDKATEGPWIADEFCMHRAEKVRVGTNDGSPLYYHNSANICECSVNFRGKSVLDGNKREPKIGVVTAERNADFIAHARSDIPFLLDQLASAREEIGRLRAALTEIAELDKHGGYNTACHTARAALEKPNGN